MKASPSHRGAGASRTGHPFRAEAALALLALLAQIVLPHVHRWQVAAHRAASPGLHAAPAAPALDPARVAADHAESTCPVCQALAASHDFLVTTAHHGAPVVSVVACAVLLDARAGHTPGGEHAPRSPPLAT